MEGLRVLTGWKVWGTHSGKVWGYSQVGRSQGIHRLEGLRVLTGWKRMEDLPRGLTDWKVWTHSWKIYA